MRHDCSGGRTAPLPWHEVGQAGDLARSVTLGRMPPRHPGWEALAEAVARWIETLGKNPRHGALTRSGRPVTTIKSTHHMMLGDGQPLHPRRSRSFDEWERRGRGCCSPSGPRLACRARGLTSLRLLRFRESRSDGDRTIAPSGVSVLAGAPACRVSAVLCSVAAHGSLEFIVSSLHAARTCRENIGGATGIRRGHQSSRIASTEVAPKGRSDESDSSDG
jgi:hypothetical protein